MNDLDKWLIIKLVDKWAILPPVVDAFHAWPEGRPDLFATGAEAHAAFARGGRA